MSETRFTAAPWYIERGLDGAFCITTSPTEGIGAVLCERHLWPDRADESRANALLIAAAPDLYAALSEAYSVLSEPEVYTKFPTGAARIMAHDALSKARGES